MNTEKPDGNDKDTADRVLRFNHVFCINDVSSIKTELLRTFDSSADVSLDFSETENIDTAAMQLLLAYSREAKKRGICINWQGLSESFFRVVDLLDIRTELGLQAPPARF